MESDFAKQIKGALADDSKLKIFSEANGIALDVARKFLEKLLEQPEIAEKAKEYIFSDKHDDIFKSYISGEQVGRKHGHDEGFMKGVVMGMLAVLAVGGVVAVKLKA